MDESQMDETNRPKEKQIANLKLTASILYRLKHAKAQYEDKKQKSITYSEFLKKLLNGWESINPTYNELDRILSIE